MQLTLDKNQIVDLSQNYKNYHVSCSKGRCWLTREGDSRDLVLRSGGNVLIEGHNVMLTVIDDAELSIKPAYAVADTGVLTWEQSWHAS